MPDSWPILDLDAIEDRAGEVDPLDDIRALCADVRRKLAALAAAERARDQAEAERDALRKKLASADEGLNRWCAWQDGLKTVHDEMGIREEIYRRLVAAGYGPGPTCEHVAERDRARDIAVALEQENAQLRAELEAFVAGHPHTLAANTISAILARTDPEHEHCGDNGTCFECGAATDPAAGR